MKEKVTVPSLIRKRVHGEKITMISTYDFTFASLCNQASIDVLLVGDSLGNVIQGHQTTLPVTLDEMIYHTKAVSRASTHSLVVSDLPFMSYQVSPEDALRASGRLMKQAGAEAVKLEGGMEVLDSVSKIVRSGIPVMGHLGLTPQSVHMLGGYKLQGNSSAKLHSLVNSAKALEEAGAFAIVLELLPQETARAITESVAIPTIGIGAGPHCSGQVLVSYDLLGITAEPEKKQPKFLKKYLEGSQLFLQAFSQFAEEVRNGTYPAEVHSYSSLKLQNGGREV